jgi:iron complex transport system ATP-binding protein
MVTAIVGPNGAGKSTLVRVLGGLRSPNQGRVEIDQTPLGSISVHQRAHRIGFLEQRPTLAFEFSVQRVVSFGAFVSDRDCTLIPEALEKFELRELAAMPFTALSVGQQQRVSFARAWVQITGREGAYLLADEPCSAMDPKHTLLTMHSMRELASTGVGVGVVIHDLALAIKHADRAIVMGAGGAVAAAGDARDVMNSETLSSIFDVSIDVRHIEPIGPVVSVGDPVDSASI